MKIFLFVILAGILLLSYGCGNIIAQLKKMGGDDSSITAKKLVPAEVDVSKFKKIAILDFEGRGGKEVSEWMENAFQNVRVGESPFFEVINRSKMMKLFAEQRLSLTGFVDANQAAKIGKISGTQAIVVGRVSSYRVADNRYTKEVTEYKDKRKYTRNVQCQVRDAYVDFTVSFMDSQTGQIIASTSAEGQYVGDSCKAVGSVGDLLANALFGSIKKETENYKIVNIDSGDRMIKGAAMLAIEQFVKKITPHYEVVPISILNGDPSDFASVFKEKPAIEKQIDVYYDTGYKYAVRSQWEDAIKQWEKILEIENRRPAATYNLGVAFEMTGDLFLAEKQFKTAVEISPDDLFFDALARVRKSIDERKKIAQQTGKSVGRVKDQSAMAQGGSSSISEQKIAAEQKLMSSDDVKDKGQTVQTPKNDSIYKIKSASSQVRNLPQNKAKIIATLKEGKDVVKLEEKGDWLKVRVVNNNSEIEGWIIKYDCEGYTKKQKIKKKELPSKKKTPHKQEGKKKVSPM